MAPAKRYKVLVGSDVVYSGPWRTAEIVYASVSKALYFANSATVVTLAFDL